MKENSIVARCLVGLTKESQLKLITFHNSFLFRNRFCYEKKVVNISQNLKNRNQKKRHFDWYCVD